MEGTLNALDLAEPRGELAGTTLDVPARARAEERTGELRLGLCVLWWPGEPGRVGEVVFPGATPGWFGRAAGAPDGERLPLLRQRPGKNERARPVADPFLSRRHLELVASAGSIGIECAGKQPLVLNGVPQPSARARLHDVVEVRGVCSLLCVERPLELEPAAPHDFGEPDAHGIVGESHAAWELRRRIEFVARRGAHVLVSGPSGTGKELVARALHQRSSRSRKALVARNAATLPPALLDAELYGNAANYPNAGMAERPGLIGEAEGSTLFLDEIGELSTDLQAHLLRVLDAGEYQRLGEARARVADFRFIAATNRTAASLKPDLLARLALAIQVPGLEGRREDIPLIARDLVRRIARREPDVQKRFVDAAGEPRFAPELVAALTQHEYTTHVRELESLLWRSLQSSPGAALELTAEVKQRLRVQRAGREPEDVSRQELRAALARHSGVKEQVWRELGLSSRHALLRLMKKLGET